MFKTLLIGLGVIVLAGSVAANEIAGFGIPPAQDPIMRAEDLFQGDLVAEIGIGCSNPSGTSGGPNDIAVGVIAALAPPFLITDHFYFIFTQVNPGGLVLSFKAWRSPITAELPIGTQGGLDGSMGPHTIAIIPNIEVPTFIFHFGHSQPQTTHGMRWGLDTNSGSEGTSYIKAPSCGANVFTVVDALGFPGNWVMAVTVDQCVPVELMTWGSVKAMYK